ncbi:hypothetical protein NDU88_003741 [Pleurodeles waltl]|uniref:Uncharacterized protein n=1 Tax=Pleurodeles waltl TaxID=8319 RepID=A0AAV7TPA4_PLEWA|nr:hypothetical protein NDU88_003741 [Pleurodeles waltl]
MRAVQTSPWTQLCDNDLLDISLQAKSTTSRPAFTEERSTSVQYSGVTHYRTKGNKHDQKAWDLNYDNTYCPPRLASNRSGACLRGGVNGRNTKDVCVIVGQYTPATETGASAEEKQRRRSYGDQRLQKPASIHRLHQRSTKRPNPPPTPPNEAHTTTLCGHIEAGQPYLKKHRRRGDLSLPTTHPHRGRASSSVRSVGQLRRRTAHTPPGPKKTDPSCCGEPPAGDAIPQHNKAHDHQLPFGSPVGGITARWGTARQATRPRSDPAGNEFRTAVKALPLRGTAKQVTRLRSKHRVAESPTPKKPRSGDPSHFGGPPNRRRDPAVSPTSGWEFQRQSAAATGDRLTGDATPRQAPCG